MQFREEKIFVSVICITFIFFFKNNYRYLYYRFSLPLKILVKKRIFEKGRLVYCSYLPLEEQKCLRYFKLLKAMLKSALLVYIHCICLSKACSSMAWATFSTCGHFTTRHSQFLDKFTAIVKPPNWLKSKAL